MLAVVRNIWALLVAIALLMIGTGLQGSLLSLRAAIEGFGVTTIGIIMTAYYLGFLVSSYVSPKLIQSVGHIRVFAAFASLGSVTVLLHPLFPDPILWLAMRFVTGMSVAGLYVVTESWLNDAATNENRGQTLSLYMITVHAFLAFGQVILAFTNPAAIGPFIFVSVLVSLALIPVSLTTSRAPSVAFPRLMSLGDLYRASPLGFSTCFLVGLTLGGLHGMGAIYADQLGLSVTQIGILMGTPFIMAVITQYPIGYISDKIGRRKVMLVVALVTGALALYGSFQSADSFIELLIVFALYGGLSSPLYSLAIAHTNDHLEASMMVGASAKMVFLNGLGASFGPFIVGTAMSWAGPSAFFIYGAVFHFLMGLIVVWRMTQRESVAEEDRGDYVPISIRVTPIVAMAAIEDAEENQ